MIKRCAMKNIVFVFLFFVFFSCKESRQEVVYIPPVFDEVVKRSVSVIGETLDDVGSKPMIHGDFIIMEHQSLKNEKIFHAYNKYTGKYMCGFGVRGRGEGELIHITGISIDEKTNSMMVGSFNRDEVFVFSLDSLEYGEVAVSTQKMKQIMSGRNLLKLGERHYCSVYNSCYRFLLYDKNFNIIDSSNFYSPISGSMVNSRRASELYYSYCSNCSSKPDGTKFVNLTLSGAILEIFEIGNNKIKHLRTKYYYQPMYDEESGLPRWDETMGAAGITATNKYIYVVFIDTPNREAPIYKISVLDWEGNPIKQYDLGVDLMRIGIDEEFGKGYVVFRDDNYEYHLGVFNL